MHMFEKEEVVDAMYALVIKQTIENPQCIHYTRWYPPSYVSWFIIPINYRYNPHKP